MSGSPYSTDTYSTCIQRANNSTVLCMLKCFPHLLINSGRLCSATVLLVSLIPSSILIVQLNVITLHPEPQLMRPGLASVEWNGGLMSAVVPVFSIPLSPFLFRLLLWLWLLSCLSLMMMFWCLNGPVMATVLVSRMENSPNSALFPLAALSQSSLLLNSPVCCLSLAYLIPVSLRRIVKPEHLILHSLLTTVIVIDWICFHFDC